MLVGVLRARRQDKDGVQITVHLKCTLDREDCTSLRFPFILPYAWISRRDSCLVGVSCHIPSFWHCTSTSLWWCIMFTFTESWNGDCPNPSILRIHQVHLKYFQSIQVAFKNVHHLWKNAGNSNQRWCTFFHVILDLWTNIYCIWVGANICYIYF